MRGRDCCSSSFCSSIAASGLRQSLTRRANQCNSCTNGGRVPFGNQYPAQCTAGKRLYLDVDLICFDLCQHLSLFYRVTFFFDPAENLALFHRIAHLGHFYFFHLSIPLATCPRDRRVKKLFSPPQYNSSFSVGGGSRHFCVWFGDGPPWRVGVCVRYCVKQNHQKKWRP